MKRTMFIDDKTKFGDEEKVIHHILYDEMMNFNKRNKNYMTFLIVAVLLAIAGLVLILTSESRAWTVMLVTGLIGLIVTVLLISMNKLSSKVNKIGIVYLPVSRMPFQNGSILIDRAGIFNPVKFQFNSLDNEHIAIISETFDSLKEHVRKMPLILSTDKSLDISIPDSDFRKEGLKIYSEELDFINLNERLCEGFSNKRSYTLDLNALKFDNMFYSWLGNNNNVSPDAIIESVSNDKLTSDLNLINGVVKMYNSSKEAAVDIDDLCVQLLGLLNSTLPRHDFSVHNSLNKVVVPLTYRQTSLIERASFNFYCPSCNKDLIDKLFHGTYAHNGKNDNRVNFPSTTMMEMIDLDRDLWKCPLCETVTDTPFPKHKMEDELFTPVYDKLYEEHFVDRLKIYNNINDQKRTYSEKAETNFHEVFRETRTKVDNIKSKIRSVGAEIESDFMAIGYLNSVITKYKLIEAQKSREITADTESHKREIAAESRKSRDAIDSAVNQAQSDIAAATEKYATLEREDQSRRDSVQKQIAENTLMSAEANADTVRVLTGHKPKRKY
jgi:hypothetical protein